MPHRWGKPITHKDAGADAGASLNGPGGLLATPGLSGGKKRWGKRLKAVQFSGETPWDAIVNHYSLDIEQEASFEQALARQGIAKTDPVATLRDAYLRYIDYPDQSQFAGHTMEDWDDTKPDSFYKAAPRATTTKAKQIVGNLYRGDNGKFQKGGASGPATPGAAPTRTATPQKGDVLPAVKPLAKPKGGKGSAKPKVKPVDPRQAKRDAEHDMLLQQRQDDRATRIARQQQADADKAKREADKLAKANAPKGGGGGGGKDKPSDEEKKQQADAKKQQTAADTAKQMGLKPEEAAFLRGAADGNLPNGSFDAKRLMDLGLVQDTGDTTEATDQGRRALSALERGDTRGYQAAIQDAKSRLAREASAKQRAADAAKRAQDAADKKAQPKPVAAPKADRPIGQRRLTVFKDASGQHRWLARTTTAYEDRDREIISSDALDRDSQRMMASKQFGPLRWWHVGTPDPLSDSAPWGTGVDLGDCDYSALIGRTRVESGTFKSAALADAVARIADSLEMSPGFFHPLDQPAGGVFTDIRTFERSLVPTRYGRAANLFTGFTVKEYRPMDLNEMEKRFKAAIQELQLSPEQAQALGAQLVATEKAAAQQGIAFKSESAPTDITINGVVYTVKAAPPMPPAAAPAVDAAMSDESIKADDIIDDGDLPQDEMAEETDVIGNMTIADFEAALGTMLTNALSPLVKALDIAGKMGSHMDELKSMMGGMTSKDDSRSQELATLKSQLATLTTQLAAIEGNQPAVVLPDDVAAALKSAGPESPPQPNTVQVPNDPTRPFAGLAAQTFPELYYSENGWQAKPN